MEPRNPFEFGRELDDTELVDRSAELQAIERAIANRGKLFLIGPRRYGKTSLLSAAQARIEKKGGVVLRFDAEAFETVELLSLIVPDHQLTRQRTSFAAR